MLKLNKEERDILVSAEKGECKRVRDFDKMRKRLQEAARATARKTKRVNIRISQRDLESLQVKAMQEGLPYQTLISSVLHKYVNGRLKEAV